MLTPEQLEERRNWIGASDMAAILQLCPYRSPRDVWHEKVYGLTPEDDAPRKTDAKDIGSCFETGCLDLAEVRIGKKIQRHCLTREVEGTRIRVNLDGWLYAEDGDIPVEAKTAGIVNPWAVNPDDWGDDGTDHFPPKYIIQLHCQMMATGAKYGYLTAVIGGLGHRLYRCERQDDIVEVITKAAAEFWACVEERREPEGEPPSLETLKRIVRQPESVVRIPREAIGSVIRWKEWAANERDAKAEKEQHQSESIALLGDAEGALLEFHQDDCIALSAAMGVPIDKAGEYCKLTYFADKNGRRTLRLQRADDEFLEAANDAPCIDLSKLTLCGDER